MADDLYLRQLAYFTLCLPVGLLWLGYVYWKSRRHAPPLHLIALSFLLGAFAPLAVVHFNDLLQGYGIVTSRTAMQHGLDPVLSFVVLVGLVEETAKMLVVRCTVYYSTTFDDVTHGAIYACAAALGYAAVENTQYLVSHGIAVLIGRAMLATPAHMLPSMLWGFALGVQRTVYRGRLLGWVTLLSALLAAAIVHGTYDVLMLEGQIPLAVAVLLALWWILVVPLGWSAGKEGEGAAWKPLLLALRFVARKDAMAPVYETVIGLEVHVELLTASKLFCACPNRFGAPPNTHVCAVCLGLPGTLPVVNRAAVDHLLRAAMSLDCEIPPYSKFDRKNYFYPDMPKNFQISQYDLPLAVKGFVEVQTEGPSAPGETAPVTRHIGITRIHLEEDTGKSTHSGGTGRIESAEYTLEDYNRAGVPLAEIVSEPDMRTPEEAVAYLGRLRELLRWIGVSDCKMEEGSMRCDANVSVRPRGSATFGTRTEIKNMNSLRSVQRAIEFEANRQIECIERGERIVQETRAWDEEKGVTHSLRSKEEAHDYRYFPEPDLAPLQIDEAWRDSIRASLPELPLARRGRFVTQYGLTDQDAAALTRSRAMADFFEAVVELKSPAKAVANWLMGDVSRLLNAAAQSIDESRLRPKSLHEMLALVEDGVISKKIAKDVLEEMFASGKPPADIVRDKGYRQIGSADDLRPIVEEVLCQQADTVADYLGGREKAFGFLVGQVMTATRGKASPQVANALLRQMLEEKRAAHAVTEEG